MENIERKRENDNKRERAHIQFEIGYGDGYDGGELLGEIFEKDQKYKY